MLKKKRLIKKRAIEAQQKKTLPKRSSKRGP